MKLTEIKLLAEYDGIPVGTVLKVDETTLKELLEAKTAELYDADAEAKALKDKADDERRVIEAVKAEIVGESGEKLVLAQADDKRPERIVVGADREAEKPWKNFGELALAVVKAASDPGGRIDKRLVRSDEKVLTEGVNSAGGFLVPPEYSTDLMKRAYDRSRVMNACRSVPMASNSIKIPTIAETSRADGSRAGGMKSYWIGEGLAKTESEPAFGQIELNLHKLAILTYASDELLDDATALSSLLGELAGDEIAFRVDDAVINGTGAGQPLGIMGAPCLVSQAIEAGQANTTIVSENVMRMWTRLHAASRGNSVWYVNQDCLQQLMQMAVAVGTGGIPVWLPANGVAGQPYSTLMGRPVIEIEQCQTLGTTGDIILADMSQYLLGMKNTGIESAVSIHFLFNYDKSTFRWVLRVDGQPWWASALTPKNGTTTVSPFVALAGRP